MDQLDDIRRDNPEAVKALKSIKATMGALKKLREAGLAKGPAPLVTPNAGRYGKLPRGERKSGGLAALKTTFRA